MARGGRRGRSRQMTESSARESPSVGSESPEMVQESTTDPPITPLQEPVRNPEPPPKPTFASLLDADAGTQLRYIPAKEVNGKRCPQIEHADVAKEVDYWQNAVLCAVMGANPPFEVIKGFIKRIWANFELDKILLVRKGVFLVRFVHLADRKMVENRGVYFFDSKPFIVKGWNPQMELQADSIKSLPLWVRFPNLDIKYWGMDSLSKLGSMIGFPLKTDQYTKEKTRLSYARLMIEVPIEGPFPEYIDFFTETGHLLRQSVEFEWKPIKCGFCEMLGHQEEECNKKLLRKEWRPKAQALDPPQEAAKPAQQPTQDAEGFIPVQRRANARHIPQKASQPPQHNSFQMLLNEEEETKETDNSQNDKPSQLEYTGPELA